MASEVEKGERQVPYASTNIRSGYISIGGTFPNIAMVQVLYTPVDCGSRSKILKNRMLRPDKYRSMSRSQIQKHTEINLYSIEQQVLYASTRSRYGYINIWKNISECCIWIGFGTQCQDRYHISVEDRIRILKYCKNMQEHCIGIGTDMSLYRESRCIKIRRNYQNMVLGQVPYISRDQIRVYKYWKKRQWIRIH